MSRAGRRDRGQPSGQGTALKTSFYSALKPPQRSRTSRDPSLGSPNTQEGPHTPEARPGQAFPAQQSPHPALDHPERPEGCGAGLPLPDNRDEQPRGVLAPAHRAAVPPNGVARRHLAPPQTRRRHACWRAAANHRRAGRAVIQ